MEGLGPAARLPGGGGGGGHLCWLLYLTGPLSPTALASRAHGGVQHMCTHDGREQLANSPDLRLPRVWP